MRKGPAPALGKSEYSGHASASVECCRAVSMSSLRLDASSRPFRPARTRRMPRRLAAASYCSCSRSAGGGGRGERHPARTVHHGHRRRHRTGNARIHRGRLGGDRRVSEAVCAGALPSHDPAVLRRLMGTSASKYRGPVDRTICHRRTGQSCRSPGYRMEGLRSGENEGRTHYAPRAASSSSSSSAS